MKTLKIHIGSDHGGFDLKQKILQNNLKTHSTTPIEFVDWGTNSLDSVDYPDVAFKVCQALRPYYENISPEVDALKTENLGLLICGSGQGMSMSANKFSWSRAALCWDTQVTQLAREHNNANQLCLGGRLLDEKLAFKILDIFIKTPFQGGRHGVRVKKMQHRIGN